MLPCLSFGNESVCGNRWGKKKNAGVQGAAQLLHVGCRLPAAMAHASKGMSWQGRQGREGHAEPGDELTARVGRPDDDVCLPRHPHPHPFPSLPKMPYAWRMPLPAAGIT